MPFGSDKAAFTFMMRNKTSKRSKGGMKTPEERKAFWWCVRWIAFWLLVLLVFGVVL